MFQAGLVTVLAGQEEGGPPACLAVSPEGTVRYWSSAAQEAAFVEVSHAPATPPATPPAPFHRPFLLFRFGFWSLDWFSFSFSFWGEGLALLGCCGCRSMSIVVSRWSWIVLSFTGFFIPFHQCSPFFFRFRGIFVVFFLKKYSVSDLFQLDLLACSHLVLVNFT